MLTGGSPHAAPSSRFIVGTAMLVVVASLAGVVLMAFAMAAYPGGNAIDAASPGHSLWLNFLCDLTGDTAVNGLPNHEGALMARAAMLALAVAVAAFWVVAPICFTAGRLYRRLVVGSGLSSVVGLLAVPVASGWTHKVAIFTSTLPALVAGILTVVGLARDGRSRTLLGLGCASVALALVDACLYARSFMDHPRVPSMAVPLFQRLALLSVVAWMATTAFTVLRARARAAPLFTTNGDRAATRF